MNKENRSCSSSIRSLFLDVLLYVTMDVKKIVIIYGLREMRLLKSNVIFLILHTNLRIQPTAPQVLSRCVADCPVFVKMLVEEIWLP